MGGTVKGRVDCVVGQAAVGNRNAFVNIKQFFDDLVTAGYGAIHASQFGAGASGFDFHDGSEPAGENAFFVFEWALSAERPGGGSALGKVYTLVQWADVTTFGSAPGNPGLLRGAGGDGVGFQTAFREDGGDPWNGTTNANGTDTKGAQVWTAGVSTLHILDYSCGSDGNYSANMENCISPGMDLNSLSSRFHLLADEDNFIVLVDVTDDGSYGVYFSGLYTQSPEITASYPMICITMVTLPLITGASVYGVAGGNGQYEGGLVSGDVLGPQVAAFRLAEIGYLLSNTLLQPNPQTPGTYDEYHLVPYNYDALKLLYGWPGTPALLREAYNVATNETNAALTRATFGSNTVASRKLTTPWGGGVTPGTGSVRTGRSF